VDLIKAEQAAKRCGQAVTALINLKGRTETSRAVIEEKLANTKVQLSKDLVSLYLQEITDGEVQKTRFEVADLERQLNDIPLLLAGTEERLFIEKKQWRYAVNEVNSCVEHEKYKNLKSQMRAQFTGGVVDQDGAFFLLSEQLRNSAEAINQQNDCQAFLKSFS